MPAIITATDFSDVASQAVNYSCRLASDLHMPLLVLHSFIVPVSFSDTPMPVLPVTDAQQIAEDKMRDVIAALKSEYPDLDISGKVVYGDVLDNLDDKSTDLPEPWLIVIGNSKESTWFSGTAVDALKSLRYPVLAIPAGTVYKPVKQICFAYDHTRQPGAIALQQLKAIITALHAQLHVLNISDSGTDDRGNITADMAALQPQYHFITGDNIDDSIKNFADTKEADWIVVLPHKHSIMWEMFHTSHTAAIAKNSVKPILALHDGE